VQAVAFFEHGGPEVLEVVDWHEPVAGPGEVVVAVQACGLNHLDIFVRRGMPGVTIDLPRISGGDIAGVVSQVGPGVRDVRPGTRVLVDPLVVLPDGRHGALGENTQGGLCDAIAVPAENLLPLPDTISFEAAAALPIAYGTALRMLITRGNVTGGESVVVLGASGGVGTACVQLAKMLGATVFAVASADDKLERLRALGADHLIKARGAEFGAEVWRLTGKQGADVIVDYTGKDTWPTSLRTLRAGGRLLTCGATSGYEATTDLRYVWTREQTIIGSDGWTRHDLEQLLSLVADGAITPVIDRVVPLDSVADAEAAIERREVFGKVIVAPPLGRDGSA
jgi:alcohol dehydrogenase